MLDQLYDEFALLFPKLRNNIEVGLKLVGKKEWLEQEIGKDPQIADLKQNVNNKSEAAAFYDRMQLGEHAAKQNEPTDPRMLLNAAFLIDRDKEASCDEKVNELYEKWREKAEFMYTGLWPPYNFINIRLKIEGDSRR